MLGHIRGEVRFRESLAYHTTLRCGGPADLLVVPQDVDDLRWALGYAHRERLPVAVLGGGNSLVAGEEGFRGIAIKLDGGFTRMEFHGDQVTAGAGVDIAGLVREATARGLGGLECVAGIPGTVGGALATSAGSPESTLADRVVGLYYLAPDGTLADFRASAGFAYRGFQPPPGSVYLAARLALVRQPQSQVRERVREWVQRRKTSLPRALASAGFVWNDPAGHSADRLIRAAGMKGKRVGNAEVSAKHTNFIVSRGPLTAADVLGLMDLTSERVYRTAGVRLEPRIRILGRC
jgi:UDP-N-acetylmuramate dehydrogenase